jgi:hypothetical protein
MEHDNEYYESLDKRTKEYKDWKAQQPSEGLGDTIEKITEATGIKSVVKWLAGEDCGCDERKEKLNEIWRYRKTNCLTESEYEWLHEFFNQEGTIRPSGKRKMIEIYNRVFNARQGDTTCKSCIRDIATKMRKVYEAYNS